jgi:hypothetical protein
MAPLLLCVVAWCTSTEIVLAPDRRLDCANAGPAMYVVSLDGAVPDAGVVAVTVPGKMLYRHTSMPLTYTTAPSSEEQGRA